MKWKLLNWTLFALAWGITFYGYFTLPDIIPIHKNGAGKVDGYGSKGMIFFVPAIMSMVALMVAIAPKINSTINIPVKITEDNKVHVKTTTQDWMASITTAVICLMIIIVLDIIYSSQNPGSDHSRYIVPFALCFFMFQNVYFIYKISAPIKKSKISN